MTFKESIQQKLIAAAKEYSKLVGCGFVIRSNDFKYRNEVFCFENMLKMLNNNLYG